MIAKDELISFVKELAEVNNEIFYFENGDPELIDNKIEFLIKPKVVAKDSLISKKYNLFDNYPEKVLREKIEEFSKKQNFSFEISAVTHVNEEFKPVHCIELKIM